MPVYITSALRNVCKDLDTNPFPTMDAFLKALNIKEDNTAKKQINKNQLNILANVLRVSQNSHGLNRNALSNIIWSAGEGEYSQQAFNQGVFTQDMAQLIEWGLLSEMQNVVFVPILPNQWRFDVSRNSQHGRDSQGNFAQTSQSNLSISRFNSYIISEQHEEKNSISIDETPALIEQINNLKAKIANHQNVSEPLLHAYADLNAVISTQLQKSNNNSTNVIKRKLSSTSVLSLSLGSYPCDSFDADLNEDQEEVNQSNNSNKKSKQAHATEQEAKPEVEVETDFQDDDRSQMYNVPEPEWEDCNYGKSNRSGHY